MMSSKPVDNAKTFAEFADLCESILKAVRKDKKDLLTYYIKSWKSDPGYDPSKPETSFFPCLRLLCPSLDRSRPAYGLKEYSLAREYLKILGINKDSEQGNMIINYKLPKYAKVDGDLSSVIRRVMLQRAKVQKSDLTIREINDRLTRIALANQESDHSVVSATLEYLIKRLGPLENKWLIRIILKSLNFGFSENLVLNTFHPDARSFYDCNQDLAEVCIKLHDDRVRGFQVSLTIFKPFLPMLSERVDIKKINSITSGKPFCIEKKFDGERIIIHKRGDTYKYFSRNGFDYSESFNESFTPFVESCFSKISDVIIDGEMMGFNIGSGRLITKNEQNHDVKKLTREDLETVHPVYFVFDMMVLNGEQLTHKTFKERLNCLTDHLQPKQNWLMMADKHEGTNVNDVVRSLNEAIERREEGIIVKFWDSVYKPNTRKKGGWYKFKPEYIEGLMDDLDLLIVGGYYGEGRRVGIMSQFLLGIAVKDDDCIDGRRFKSFGRVGSGYTDQELASLLQKLEPHWIKYDNSDPPSFLELAKTKPEYYIEPEKSFILQVKASEFQETDDFPTGITLRFPRVVCIRYDKSWSDCMTTEELSQLRDQGNLMTRQIDYFSDGSEPSHKKRRGRVDDKRLAPHLMVANLDSIKVCRDIFHGKEICVLNGSPEMDKSSIEKLITQFDGKITANPTKDTYCLIVHTVDDLRVKNLIKSRNYDIIKLDWFLRVMDNLQFIDPSYHDYIVMTLDTEVKLKRYFDPYGDSFFSDINENDLLSILERVDDDKINGIEDHADTRVEFEDDILPSINIFVLHNFTVYIEPIQETHSIDYRLNLSLIRSSIIFHGGKISDNCTNCSHQLVLKGEQEEKQIILQTCQSSTPNFIFDCNQCQWLTYD